MVEDIKKTKKKVVMIVACQVMDPGSIPSGRNFEQPQQTCVTAIEPTNIQSQEDNKPQRSQSCSYHRKSLHLPRGTLKYQT
jgi:hypothetical protein